MSAPQAPGRQRPPRPPARTVPRAPVRRRGLIARFVERYGWRAYALPLLTVLTIAVALSSGNHAKPSGARNNGAHGTTAGQPAPPRGATAHAAPPTMSGDRPLKTDQPGSNAQNEVLASDALPPGAPYSGSGAGTFRTLSGTGPVVGSGTLHRYTIDVENGISGADLNQYAAIVQSVLSDRRSWIGHDNVALQRVDSGPVDWRITLTSPMTVRQLCGYELRIETSCFDPSAGRVVLNLARWVRGDNAYVGDLANYRIYMVNHEDGHALGHSHSHLCLPNGFAAVMMQQTITLKARNGQMCTANPWPYPPGVPGTPGIEDPGT